MWIKQLVIFCFIVVSPIIIAYVIVRIIRKATGYEAAFKKYLQDYGVKTNKR